MTGRPPRLFVIAGEPSGDLLGGRLLAALRDRVGPGLEVAGIGGEAMRQQGLASMFPMAELSLMGLVEVLPHLRQLGRRLAETVDAIREMAPDAVVTIDVPAFCLRVARRLRGSGIPVIHYVAPSVWAWRPGRARRLAGTVDHLLALLPFEPPYFTVHGLACSYVGHPVLETVARSPAPPRRPVGAAPTLCLLPGSRRGEIARHLPIFAEVVERLRPRFPRLTILLPTVAPVAEAIRSAVAGWPVPVRLVQGEARYAAMAEADAALSASGTVVLELAALGVPTVACYRVNPLTAAVVRRLIRVRYVTLVNLLLDRPLVPELLQEHCTAPRLADAVAALLEDEAARRRQQEGFAEALATLAVAEPPSMRAAGIVLGMIGRARRSQSV
jgi:lipid-A-disaccharide synthase